MGGLIKLYVVFMQLKAVTVDILTGHFSATVFLFHSIINFGSWCVLRSVMSRCLTYV